jgi:hypothetical protein
MAGFIKLTGVNPPTDRPRADLIDNLLPAAGALALIELAHPANPVAGVPAQGALIPNLAWQQARALLGAGDESSLSATFARAAGFTEGAPTYGLVERSAKGGLHGITRQSLAVPAGSEVSINLPAAIRERLRANRKVYVSAWYRVTRANGAVVGTVEHVVLIGDPANNATGTWAARLFRNSDGNVTAQNTYPSSTNNPTRLEGAQAVPTGNTQQAATIAPAFSALGINSWSPAGAPPAALANVAGKFIVAGQPVGDAPAVAAAHSSRVFLRGYVEDLDVSGRTFAQVAAADYAEYTRQVLTPGGRYYADTNTNPADYA